MSTHRDDKEPWEEILGLKSRQHWGRELRECVAHLAEGWSGGRWKGEGQEGRRT